MEIIYMNMLSLSLTLLFIITGKFVLSSEHNVTQCYNTTFSMISCEDGTVIQISGITLYASTTSVPLLKAHCPVSEYDCATELSDQHPYHGRAKYECDRRQTCDTLRADVEKLSCPGQTNVLDVSYISVLYSCVTGIQGQGHGSYLGDRRTLFRHLLSELSVETDRTKQVETFVSTPSTSSGLPSPSPTPKPPPNSTTPTPQQPQHSTTISIFDVTNTSANGDPMTEEPTTAVDITTEVETSGSTSRSLQDEAVTFGTTTDEDRFSIDPDKNAKGQHRRIMTK